MNTLPLYLFLLVLFLMQAATDMKTPSDLISQKRFNVISTTVDVSRDVDSLAFIINNSLTIDLNEELKRINKLNPSPEKSYLNSLLNKRGGNFVAMYDTLFSGLKLKPSFISYYTELAFASRAAGQDSSLQDYLSNNKMSPVFMNYLLGQLSSGHNDHAAALKLYETAAAYDSTDPEILFEAASEHKQLGDYEKSFEYLKKCEALAAKYLVPKIELAKGTLYFLSGEYEKAKEHYLKSEFVSEEIKDYQGLTSAKVDLGIIADMGGNVEDARAYYSEAINIAESINYIDGKAFAYSEMGVSYTFTNELVRAKRNYIRSYELYKKLGNRFRLSLLSDNIGKIYMAMFDLPSARKFYEEGLQFAGDNIRARILNLTGLADVYSNLSNYGKALEYYKKAEKLSSGIKELELEAEINNGIGIINYNLRNYKSALKYFSSSRDLVNGSDGNLYLQGDYLYKCALSYMELDSLEKAEEYFSKTLLLCKNLKDTYLQANVLADASQLQYNKKNFTPAGSLLSEAMMIAQKHDYKIILARLFLLKGDFEKSFTLAKMNYESALRISSELNNFDLIIQCYSSLGELCQKNNLPELASTYYESAISMAEDVARPLFKADDIQIKYFSSKQDIYKSYAELLISNQQYEKAFLMIDRSKSRNMIQNLSVLKMQSLVKDNAALEQLYEYEWMIHSGLHNNVLDSLKYVYAVYKGELTLKYPYLEKYLNPHKQRSLKDYQKKLSENENIVSLYTTDNYSIVFIVNKSSFTTFPISYGGKEVKELLKNISPYYSVGKEDDNTFYNQDLFSFNSEGANQFYNIFLKEPLKKISGKGSLIIVPSIETLYLPFEMLVTEKKGGGSPYDYKDVKYLLMDHEISYAPSLGAYIDQKANDLKNSDRLLVLGDPRINTTVDGYSDRRGLLEDNPGVPRNISLLPLKYSKEEVMEVGDIIEADQILLDQNATETNFKKNASLSKIIHLSTHSFLVSKQPVIFLSNVYDPGNDGFLEASEIAEMNLNSDLVVLSSCKSGLGEIDESEGVLGMTKAFFEAGSKSVVVSLWEVNDKFTSRLMSIFYEKLGEGLEKSEALRQAKIEIIEKYSPNPYYWGAFVLSGNTGKLLIKHNAGISWYWLLLFTILLSAGIFYFIQRSRSNTRVRAPYQDQTVS